MHFKFDKEFHSFCAMAGINQPFSAVRSLYNLAEKEGVFEQTDSLYGARVIDWLGDEMAVARVITAFTGRVCTVALYAAFMQLVVIGEGDCPECGSVMEEIDWEVESLHDGNGICPDSVNILSTTYRCPMCGATITQ